jgi:hypothetical protein
VTEFTPVIGFTPESSSAPQSASLPLSDRAFHHYHRHHNLSGLPGFIQRPHRGKPGTVDIPYLHVYGCVHIDLAALSFIDAASADNGYPLARVGKTKREKKDCAPHE